MRSCLLAGLAGALGVALASPAVQICPECPKLKSSLLAKHATSTASKFCSSYLHISTYTKTKTCTVTPTVRTATTVTATAATTTVSVTATVSTDATVLTTTTLDPVTITSVVSTTSTTPIACFTAATTLVPVPVVPAAELPTKRGLQATPACFQGWQSKALSSACRCLSLTTPTATASTTVTAAPTTVTATVTTQTTPVTTITASTVTVPVATTVVVTETPSAVTSVVTASFIVGAPVATGMDYYVYRSSYDYNPVGPGVNPGLFQNNNNYYSRGRIADLNSVGGSDGTASLPAGDVDIDGVAIVFQGFFFAPLAGVYKFSTPDTIDNELMMWHGPIAYGVSQPWSKSTLDYNALRVGNTPATWGGGAKGLVLAAGEVVPITVIWGNNAPVGQLYYHVTDPLDRTTSTTGHFTPQCDGGPFQP